MNTLTPISVKDLSVNYGSRKVLSIPALEINSGEMLVVIGPNGSGKTTLLLNLSLLTSPTTGVISYFGNPVTHQSNVLELRRRVSVAFQEPLLMNSSVWDNVMLGLRLHRVDKKMAQSLVREWLNRFGVLHLAKRSGKTLSGGEAKRVSLARAFALEPEVLFLDEPFTGLDSPTRQALTDDFEKVLRETRLTTVMVTHDRNEALALADRVIVLINGIIRQTGTPEQVFNYPADEEVATFVEAGNIWHGKIIEQHEGLAIIESGNRMIEAVSSLKTGSDVTACLKFEDITLSKHTMVTSSARNSITGKITRIVNLGAQTRVTLDGGVPLIALITRRSQEELGLAIGDTVTATFKATAIHLISRG